jgi:hypothetical protein
LLLLLPQPAAASPTAKVAAIAMILGFEGFGEERIGTMRRLIIGVFLSEGRRIR